MPLTEIMKDLRGQKADVYSKCIIPAIGNKIIRDIYKSFGIGEIESVRRTGKKLVYKYKDNTKSTISSKKVFAKKAFPTEEDIKISKLKRKEEKARADQEEIQKLKEEILQKNPKAINRIEKTKTIKRKRGRPKGSKNKRKTEEVGRKRTLKATLQTRSEKVKVKAELLETKEQFSKRGISEGEIILSKNIDIPEKKSSKNKVIPSKNVDITENRLSEDGGNQSNRTNLFKNPKNHQRKN
jgi:hypothetical protein